MKHVLSHFIPHRFSVSSEHGRIHCLNLIGAGLGVSLTVLFFPCLQELYISKQTAEKNRKLQNQLDCLATFLSSFLSYFCVILLSQIVTLHSNFKVENQLFNVLRRSLPLTDRSFCSLESVGRLLIPGLVITPRGY